MVCRAALVLAALALGPAAAPADPPTEATGRRDALGDPLPERALARLGTARFRHGSAVTALAAGPGGAVLASGGRDGTVRLWAADTGRLLATLAGDEPVAAVALAGQHGWLAVGHAAGHVLTWDLATAQPRSRSGLRPTTRSLVAVAFSADDLQTVAVTTAGGVALEEELTGAVLSEAEGLGGPSGLGLAADARTAVFAGEWGDPPGPVLGLWDVATRRVRHRLSGHAGPVVAAALSTDGGRVASAGRDRSLRLWDTATGNELVRVPWAGAGGDHPPLLALAPDGGLLAAATPAGTVLLWRAADGRLLRRLVPPDGAVLTALCFAADGQLLAAGDESGAIHRWEVTSGRRLPVAGDGRAAAGPLALSPDGRSLAVAGLDGPIGLYDLAALRDRPDSAGRGRLIGLSSAAVGLAWSGDGRSIAAGDGSGSVVVWDVATAAVRDRAKLPEGRLGFLAFADPGRLLTAPEPSGPVRVLEPASGGRSQPILGAPLAVTADRRLLALVAGEGRVRLVESAGGRERLTLPGAAGEAAAFAPDGRSLFVGMADGAVRRWDIVAGQPAGAWSGLRDRVTALAVSPDGLAVVTASAGGAVRLWDAAQGRLVKVFRGHHGAVRQVAFSGDGRTVVSSGADGTVLVWDVAGLAPNTLSDRDLEALWNDLAAEDAAQVHRAVWSLTAAGRQVVPFLERRLSPAVPSADPQRLQRLLADLDSPQYPLREQATQELRRYGPLAEPALRRRLEGSPGAELRQRLQRLLDRLSDPAATNERLQAVRAVEVLERVATPEARRALEALARGAAGHWLTQEARAAAGRLRRNEE
jgi:WD40 repeat protein